MKSLYTGIVLALLGIISVSFFLSLTFWNHIEDDFFNPVFEKMDELQLEDARTILERGGPAAVSVRLARLNDLFGGRHYLLDSRGLDVVDATSRSQLLPQPPLSKSRGPIHGQFLVTHKSPDGRYWLVTVAPLQPARRPFFPYYLLIVGTSAFLCYLAAVGVVSPLRRMARAVDQFGKGDLSVRLLTIRRDEIGVLMRAFNDMASRVQGLLVNERRLLQDVSHELRTPLARLNFSVKLARTAPDREAALDQVKRDVDRLTVLVSELVEVTRLERGSDSQMTETIRLEAIVTETVQDCALESESRGCSIQVTGELRSEIKGNRELLRRAIENVLRNAIRYSPPNASIDLSLLHTATTAVITIRDYGKGVPKDLLPRIFDPFYRVDEARDAESGGLGLGLTIAQRAIQLHDGSIHAENANPGLRVQIIIPSPA